MLPGFQRKAVFRLAYKRSDVFGAIEVWRYPCCAREFATADLEAGLASIAATGPARRCQKS